jgi:hypothetical protein
LRGKGESFNPSPDERKYSTQIRTTFLMKANVFFSSFSGSVRKKNLGKANMLASVNGATVHPVAPVKMMRNSSAGKNQKENGLEWLFRPPKRPEKKEKQNGSVEETRILIGNYYYWVRVSQELPELCRTSRHVSTSVRYEILYHQNFGITDTDLDEIVRYACHPPAQVYRISGRVKRKLQALYGHGKED